MRDKKCFIYSIYNTKYIGFDRVRIISKVEKVLYSRAFFNVSSGAENVLKTYFVFGTLTKGFQKGRKSHFLVKIRQNRPFFDKNQDIF